MILSLVDCPNFCRRQHLSTSAPSLRVILLLTSILYLVGAAGPTAGLTPSCIQTTAGSRSASAPVGVDGASLSIALAVSSADKGAAIDPDSNDVFFTESSGVIRRLTPAGGLETVAGQYKLRGSVGPAEWLDLSSSPTAHAVAADVDGSFLLTRQDEHVVLRIAKGLSTIVAGTFGVSGYAGVGGAATSAIIDRPGTVAIAPSAFGVPYGSGGRRSTFCFAANCRVLCVAGADGSLVNVAGNGISDYYGDGGPATSAAIGVCSGGNAAYGLAFHAATGDLFVNAGSSIRRIDARTRVISRFYDGATGDPPGFPGEPPRLLACMAISQYPTLQVVVHPGTGALTAAIPSKHYILRSSGRAANATGVSLAGRPGTAGAGAVGGPATATALSGPRGVAINAAGNVTFVSDTGNGRILMVAPDGRTSLVAGSGAASGRAGDGGQAVAAAIIPYYLAYDEAVSRLYFVDASAAFNGVRYVDLGSGVLNTLCTASDMRTLYVDESSGDVFFNVGFYGSGLGFFRAVGARAAPGSAVTVVKLASFDVGALLPPLPGAPAGSFPVLIAADGNTIQRSEPPPPGSPPTTQYGRWTRIAGSGITGLAVPGLDPLLSPYRSEAGFIAVDAATREVYACDGMRTMVFPAGDAGNSSNAAGGGRPALRLVAGNDGSGEDCPPISAYSGLERSSKRLQMSGDYLFVVEATSDGNYFGRIRRMSVYANDIAAQTGVPDLSSPLNVKTAASGSQRLGFAVDPAGVQPRWLVTSAPGRLLRINMLTGTTDTIAGTGVSGFNTGAGAPLSVMLGGLLSSMSVGPVSAAVDSGRNVTRLYAYDQQNRRVWTVLLDVETGDAIGNITTAAGGMCFDHACRGDGFPAAATVFTRGNINGLAWHTQLRGLMIADDTKLRFMSKDSGLMLPFAGYAASATAANTADGVDALGAYLFAVGAVAVAGNGDVFVAQMSECYVRRIVMPAVAGQPWLISTIAGARGFCSTGARPAPGLQARMAAVYDLAGDPRDGKSALISIFSGGEVLQWNASTDTVTRIAGTGASGSTVDGPALATAIKPASLLAQPSTGAVYFINHEASTRSVRRLDLGSGSAVISTVAGGPGSGSTLVEGGLATATALGGTPTSLAGDANGCVYVTMTGANLVRVACPVICAGGAHNDAIAWELSPTTVRATLAGWNDAALPCLWDPSADNGTSPMPSSATGDMPWFPAPAGLELGVSTLPLLSIPADAAAIGPVATALADGTDTPAAAPSSLGAAAAAAAARGALFMPCVTSSVRLYLNASAGILANGGSRCQRVAAMSCNLTTTLDGGAGWAVRMRYRNGTLAAASVDGAVPMLQRRQTAGASLSLPAPSVSRAGAAFAAGTPQIVRALQRLAAAAGVAVNATTIVQADSTTRAPALSGSSDSRGLLATVTAVIDSAAVTLSAVSPPGFTVTGPFVPADACNGTLTGSGVQSEASAVRPSSLSLSINCSAAALYWRDAVVTVRAVNQVASAPLSPQLLPPNITIRERNDAVEVLAAGFAAPLRWGSDVVLRAHRIGAAQPATVVLLPDSAVTAVAGADRNVSLPALFASGIPCTNVAALGADALNCTLRFVTEALLWQPAAAIAAEPSAGLVVSFAGGGSRVNIPPAALTAPLRVARPAIVAVSMTSDELPRIGFSTVVFTLAQPWPSVQELASSLSRVATDDAAAAAVVATAQRLGGQWLSVRGWIGGRLCASCLFEGPESVRCTTPPGTAPVARVVLELGTVVNATSDGLHPDALLPAGATAIGASSAGGGSIAVPADFAVGYVSFEPPVLLGALSLTAVLLPPRAGSAVAGGGVGTSSLRRLNITMSSPEAAAALRNGWISDGSISIGGSACRRLLPVAAGSGGSNFEGVICADWDPRAVSPGLLAAAEASAATSAGLAVNGDATVDLPLTVRWGGRLIPLTKTQGVLTGVRRPVLFQVTPATVRPGDTLTLVGEHLCPPQACSSGADVSILVGGLPCTGVRIAAGGSSLTCIAPDVLTAAMATAGGSPDTTPPGYPQQAVHVINSAGVAANEAHAVTYPPLVRLRRMPAGADWTSVPFLPSDGSDFSPALSSADIRFRVEDEGGSAQADAVCSLAASPSSVQLRLPNAAVSLQAPADGVFSLGGVRVVTSFATPRVNLTIVCTTGLARLSASATLITVPLRVLRGCAQLPAQGRSQEPLPPWRIALGVAPWLAADGSDVSIVQAGVSASGSASASHVCDTEAIVAAARLNISALVACTVGEAPSAAMLGASTAVALGAECTSSATTGTATGSAAAQEQQQQLFLKDASAQLACDGTVTFMRLAVTGAQGRSHALQVRCSLGNVPIEPALRFNLSLDGCAPGLEPQGVFCSACTSGSHYSLGGIDDESGVPRPCISCPRAGVRCDSGSVHLLPRFYLSPGQRARRALDNGTLLLPCFNTEACTLHMQPHDDASAGRRGLLAASNDSVVAGDGSFQLRAGWEPVYGCAAGYTGPRCGVCQAPDFAMHGPVCAPCDRRLGTGLLAAFLLFATVGVLVLGHLSAPALPLEMLPPAERAKATAAKKEATARGAHSIILRITLTHIQALGAMRAFSVGGTAAFRQLTGWTEVLSASPVSAGPIQCVLQLSFLARLLLIVTAPLLISGSIALAVALIIAVRIRRALRKLGAQPLARASRGISFSERDMCRMLAKLMLQWWHDRGPLTAALFVLSLFYMPITTASLRTMQCEQQPVDDVRYLSADLSVACGSTEQVVAQVIGLLALVIIGLGFPALLVYRMWRVAAEKLDSATFVNTWGSLVGGYRRGEVPRGADISGETPSGIKAVRLLPIRAPDAALGAVVVSPPLGPGGSTSADAFDAPATALAHRSAGRVLAADSRASFAATQAGASRDGRLPRPQLSKLLSSQAELSSSAPSEVGTLGDPAVTADSDKAFSTMNPLGMTDDDAAAVATPRRGSHVPAGGIYSGVAGSALAARDTAGSRIQSFSKRTGRRMRSRGPLRADAESSAPGLACCCALGCSSRGRCSAAMLPARGNTLWWEATVLLRKALIVCLATLVTSPVVQLIGFVLLMMAAAMTTIGVMPYDSALLNGLETASLTSLIITAAASMLLLDGVADLAVVQGANAPVVTPLLPLSPFAVTGILAGVNAAILVALAAALVQAGFSAVVQPALASVATHGRRRLISVGKRLSDTVRRRGPGPATNDGAGSPRARAASRPQEMRAHHTTAATAGSEHALSARITDTVPVAHGSAHTLPA